MIKPDIKKIYNNLGFALAAVLIALGVFACSVRRGVWSTVPTVLVAAVCAEFLYSKWLINSALFACCALIVSLSDDNSLLYSALFCLGVVICYLIVHWVFLIFKKQKKLGLRALGALMLLIPIIIQPLVFSTPFAVAEKERLFKEYLSQRYPDQSFSEVIGAYNIIDGKYQALVKYDYRGFELESVIKMDGDTMEDGYFDEFCRKGLESMKDGFVSLIRARYPDESLWIDCSGKIETVDKILPGKYGESPDWLEDAACCDVGFKFAINNKSDFLSYVKEYYDYICSQGFEFYNISFYGGYGGMYKFCVTVEYGTESEDIAALIKNCNISMKIASLSMEYSYLY